MGTTLAAPIKLALVNDYDVVVVGVAHMFDQYTDRIEVTELDTNKTVKDNVDIALYDSFGQPDSGCKALERLTESQRARRVSVYTWNFHPTLIDAALAIGVRGYLSKGLTALETVEALEAIHAGELVVSEKPPAEELSVGLDWPGRAEGLTEREAELLALITQGKSNKEIAEILYLSVNSIKTHIRSAYRKIDVTNRVEAVLWGVDHGFRPDTRRIDQWTADPMIDLAIQKGDV